MVQYLKSLDRRCLDYINTYCKSRTLDRIMPIITMLGNLGIVWFVISILLMLKIDSRLTGIMVILSVLVTTIIGEGIIKHIVRRKRPFFHSKEELLISKPITYSFPSGHTASSFAALAVFIQMNGKLGLIASPIATLIAFSRVYLKVHYPSDVIFGVILGLSCGLGVMYFFAGYII